MIAVESAAWIRWMGGQALWDELGAEFGVKCFMAGNGGVQMGGWFRKEINSADDFKGLKFRMPGLGGDVLAKLGASPVSLPGSQIYENLVSGAIDGTEWVGPWNDSFLKFYEAAKFYYYPGMHEPGTITGLGINKAWWDTLPKSDQLIIESAATVLHESMYSEYNAKNGEFLAQAHQRAGRRAAQVQRRRRRRVRRGLGGGLRGGARAQPAHQANRRQLPGGAPDHRRLADYRGRRVRHPAQPRARHLIDAHR